jgi:hypothetical protein
MSRTRSTPEERKEVADNIAERERYERQKANDAKIAAILQAEKKKIQDEKNASSARERADKNSDNEAYAAIRPDDLDVFTKQGRRRRGQLEKEQRGKANDEKQYREEMNRFNAKKLHYQECASTVSLAEMRELLNGPRAPALLLSDDEDEARRSGAYDPPPPPRAGVGRPSTLWETLPGS